MSSTEIAAGAKEQATGLDEVNLAINQMDRGHAAERRDGGAIVGGEPLAVAGDRATRGSDRAVQGERRGPIASVVALEARARAEEQSRRAKIRQGRPDARAPRRELRTAPGRGAFRRRAQARSGAEVGSSFEASPGAQGFRRGANSSFGEKCSIRRIGISERIRCISFRPRTIPRRPAPSSPWRGRSTAIQLRTARWVPQTALRGTVVVLQGRSEFIEKYFEVIGELLARGFAVAAMDWRGQGGSARQLKNPRKGHIDDFSLFERDLGALVDDVLGPSCPQPWFGLCHSMGGAIMLSIAHAGRCPFERLGA